MVLPTQPRRGISPGGMPGTPMQGQGRGPNVGMPKAQSPIPSSVPGINDVAGTPDPDKIVELFTAYTSGQLSREDLINQLNVASEGQGGILGLLESMESPPEGQQDNGMLETSPNPMGGPGLPSVTPPGTIPPLEEALDERHQRIAALIMTYGLTPEDANQMSTELNPMHVMMGGRSVTEDQVNAAIESYNTQYPHAPVTGNTLATIQNIAKSGGDYADFSGTRIGQIMGGIPGTNTGLFPEISAGQDIMSTSAQSPVFTAAAKPTHTHDNFPAHDTSIVHPEPKPDPRQMMGGGPGRSPVTTPDPVAGNELQNRDRLNVSDRETGELVYDEETGQMVDSGTWMAPRATEGHDIESLTAAKRQRDEELRWAELSKGGGSVGDMAASADMLKEQAMRESGGSIGDMVADANLTAIRESGGSVGDMVADAELKKSTMPTVYGPDAPPDRSRTYGPDVVTDKGNIIGGMPSGVASIGGSAMPILGQVGGIPDWAGGWLRDYLEGMANAGKSIPGTLLDEIKDPTPILGALPGMGGGAPGGVQGGGTFDQAAYDAQVAERAKSREVLAASDATPASVPEKPLWQKDLFEDMDTRVGAYTGKTSEWAEEVGAAVPSATEPGITGFKTVDDFDIPQIKSFLNGLSEEARTGQMGMVMAPAILDAFTAINQQRQAGNIDLAKKNTDAAVAFLDRAAMVARDKAKQKLAEQQQKLESGIAIGQLTGEYDRELTFAAKTEEYRQVMERFAATGEVPQVDASGNFITTQVPGDVGEAGTRQIQTTESLEKELSYAELQQQRQISMTETFGKLLNFDREGKLAATGVPGGETMETLEAQSFGFTKMLQQQERAGTIMEPDPDNPGGFRQMRDSDGEVVDTAEMRRYAWDHDIKSKQLEWQSTQSENDKTASELQAATIQFGQQLSALIDAGKLAEAIEVRKEKSANDKRVQAHEKNQLKINTLLALAKPSTMLFAKRYGLLDSIGDALGVDFEGEGILTPGIMITGGKLPTEADIRRASPSEQQIMLAEIAAFDVIGEGYSPETALSRITEWQPGAFGIKRTAIGDTAVAR